MNFDQKFIDIFIKDLNISQKQIDELMLTRNGMAAFEKLVMKTLSEEKNSNILVKLYNKIANLVLFVFFDLFTKILDLYTVARIFHQFKPFNTTPQADNVIIYAGENHSQTIRNILDRFGFQNGAKSDASSKQQDNFQCLNISQFKQPFFT